METHWLSCSDFFGKLLKICTEFGLSCVPLFIFVVHASYQHYTSALQLDKIPYFPPCLTFFHSPSPPHFLSSSSPIFPLKLSVSPSHASLCVLFLAERCLVQPSVSYFSLFLSPYRSFSLSPSPAVPAKATHRRSFFLLLLLKSWKPCEVVWLSADGRAERVVSVRLCVCAGVFGL